MAFKFHSDAAHGWLEVPHEAIVELGLLPRDFSGYSYRKDNTFFLEEDCDASKFFRLYEAKHGREPETESVYDGYNSPIRSYPGIHA